MVSQFLQKQKWSLKHTAFRAGADDEHKLQKRGTAMGKRFSPVVAELFMQRFEESALQSSPLKLNVDPPCR